MYYRSHPEAERVWARPVHALEDWAFDRLVSALGA
jgi:hypothetical protein